MGLITRRATALLPLSTINPLLSDFACLSEVQSVIQGLCFGYGCVIELAHSDLVYRTRISTRPSFFVRASLVEGDSTIYTGIGLGGWPRLFRYKEGVDDMGPTTPLPADGGNGIVLFAAGPAHVDDVGWCVFGSSWR